MACGTQVRSHMLTDENIINHANQRYVQVGGSIGESSTIRQAGGSQKAQQGSEFNAVRNRNNGVWHKTFDNALLLVTATLALTLHLQQYCGRHSGWRSVSYIISQAKHGLQFVLKSWCKTTHRERLFSPMLVCETPSSSTECRWPRQILVTVSMYVTEVQPQKESDVFKVSEILHHYCLIFQQNSYAQALWQRHVITAGCVISTLGK